MKHLLKFEWRQNGRGFWIGLAVVALLQALMAGPADSYIGNPDMEELLKSMPQGLLEAFGIRPESMATFEGWMSGQPYTYFALLLSFFAMNWAVGSIVKERDRQTAEFLFTLPRSRTVIYFSKWLSHLLQVAVVAILSISLVIALGSASGLLNDAGNIARMMASGWLVALGFMGIGYALTPWLSSERGALSIGIGIVLLFFIFNMLSGFAESLRWLQEISLFHLFDPFPIGQGEGMPVAGMAISLVLYAAGSLAGWAALVRRDL